MTLHNHRSPRVRAAVALVAGVLLAGVGTAVGTVRSWASDTAASGDRPAAASGATAGPIAAPTSAPGFRATAAVSSTPGPPPTTSAPHTWVPLATDRTTTINNPVSDLCLTPHGFDRSATIERCSGQKWNLRASGRIVHGSGCLGAIGGGTANGTPVGLVPCSSGDAQKWTITDVNRLVGRTSGRCLDVGAFSTTPGAKVQLWDCSGGQNQKWAALPW